MQQYVLVIIEVNQPEKAPDLRHITIGSEGDFSSSTQFVKSAKMFLQESEQWNKGANFVRKATLPFNTRKDYLNFIEDQLDDYLNRLK
jgi:hypothetical protein